MARRRGELDPDERPPVDDHRQAERGRDRRTSVRRRRRVGRDGARQPARGVPRRGDGAGVMLLYKAWRESRGRFLLASAALAVYSVGVLLRSRVSFPPPENPMVPYTAF